MSEAHWFLSRQGQQFGPYTWEQLVQMARTGHVDGHDLVWRQGDAASRPARDVEGLLPTRAGGSRGVIIGLVAGVVALLIALVVVLVSRNGGDDAATDTDSSDTTEEVTTEPRRTTTVRETTTSDPSTTAEETTTAAPSTVRTTIPPLTVPPTTPLIVPTEADLLAALPDPGELPMSWAPSDGEVDTDAWVGSGPGSGLCGLDSFGARLQMTGHVAFAENPEAFLPDDGSYYLGLAAFVSAADASSFLALTADQAAACGPGFEYDIVEADGDDAVDWIDSASQDGVIWHAIESAQSVALDPAGADERLVYAYATAYTTMTFDGDDLTVTSGEVIVLERYGNVILYGALYGTWDVSGFGSWGRPMYQPTDVVCLSALDEVRDQMLTELRARGLTV